MNDFNITKTSLSLIDKINVSLYGKIAKNHSIYRQKIIEYSFDLHENLVTANIYSGQTRVRYQKAALSKLYQLDMLLGVLEKNSIIDKASFMSTIGILNNLRKMIVGWISSEENKK